MCAACGLPTNHTSLVTGLGVLALISFSVTTFAAAWLFVMSRQVRQLWQAQRTKQLPE